MTIRDDIVLEENEDTDTEIVIDIDPEMIGTHA